MISTLRGGGVNLIHPLVTLTWMGATLHHLQAEPWQPCRPRAVSTCGGSLPGDCIR